MENRKDILLNLLRKHQELGISSQLDYDKFYLYSIITHSTAIEGSTVTEVEAQLLFDEGITSSKRTMMEQMMNLDLKHAYDYGREWIQHHQPITTDWLILLASKVMEHTGSEYHAPGGAFSASKGEIRRLNVTAGLGGKSYMSYLKVPAKLQAFCEELNQRRTHINPNDICAVYELSFWAHFELVTIHPWADGNGRTSRLLMNLLQMEWNVLPTKVLKQDKADYIQALIDAREKDDVEVFLNCMYRLHCAHLQYDMDLFLQSTGREMVDKKKMSQDLSRKWSIKPSLADKLVDIIVWMADKKEITTEQIVNHFGFSETTAKRYLRQLTQFHFVEQLGANRNRKYSVSDEYPENHRTQ